MYYQGDYISPPCSPVLQVDAFDLQYLSRVVDVKDTVHKASLMLHLVELVVDKFPDSTDLYCELSHVHRIAKVRWLADRRIQL